MNKTVLMAASLAVLASCGSQSLEVNPSATDYLLVKYTDVGTPDSCKVEILSSISKGVDLYMMEYDLYLNGQKKMFNQMKFSGHDGIDYVRDKTISLVYEDATCGSYDIEWRKLECINNNRDNFDCPEIRFEGEDLFNSMTVDRS